MSAWITVYMQRDPSPITADRIRKGISQADWWTLGEDFGIDEDEVEQFMSTLQWNNSPLAFSQASQRPVRLHLWTDPSRVHEELDELQSSPGSVQPRLLSTLAVAAIEMGLAQLRTMHEVVGFEVAYWLSEEFEGVICSPDDKWYDHDEFRWSPIRS